MDCPEQLFIALEWNKVMDLLSCIVITYTVTLMIEDEESNNEFSENMEFFRPTKTLYGKHQVSK